jgi:hypothetical protein
VSQNSRAPVAAAIRPAATRPSPRSAAPRSRIAVGTSLRSAATVASIALDDTGAGADTGSGSAAASAGSHATSAGTTSVAICPGAWRAACTARAPSAATEAALVDSCSQADTGRAKPAMSEASGAS